MKISDYYRSLRLTKVARIISYTAALEKDIKIENTYDLEKINYLKEQRKKYLRKLGAISTVKVIFSFLLYASVVSNFIIGMQFLSVVVSNLKIISSLLGTTFLLIMVFTMTKIYNMYWEDIRTVSSHIISIYAKNDKKKGAEIREHLKDVVEEI